MSDRSYSTVDELLDLSSLVLRSCYFRHFDGLSSQTGGAAMGSSLGPVAANIFMAHFETLAFREAEQQSRLVPSFWVRYVDDILLFWPHPIPDPRRNRNYWSRH